MSAIPHFNVHTADWVPLPALGGFEAILYKSEDGKRLAGSFRESGTHTLKMPFDEFLYIVAGTAKITVDEKETVELGVGDCVYLFQGSTVTFDYSDDFHDVTVLVSDTPIEY